MSIKKTQNCTAFFVYISLLSKEDISILKSFLRDDENFSAFFKRPWTCEKITVKKSYISSHHNAE